MKSLLALALATLPLAAAEPLLKPATVPNGSTRVLFPLEGRSLHVPAMIARKAGKQVGSGEKIVEGKIALGAYMQAPAVATVKRLESWGYKCSHMDTVVIPEITLLGRSTDSKSKTSDVQVKLTNLKVLAQLYVFTSDDHALDADIWVRVDQIPGTVPLGQAQVRVFLAEPRIMAVTYPSKMLTKKDAEGDGVDEPAPSGPPEGSARITMALTPNFEMPCTRLNGKPFAGQPKPVAGFSMHNTQDRGSLIAAWALQKPFDLKKVNDDDAPRVSIDGQELKILNSRTSDLRFTLDGGKTPTELTAANQDLLLDQETQRPILWVGTGYLNKKISSLVLAGDSSGWKLHGYAPTDTLAPPLKAKGK